MASMAGPETQSNDPVAGLKAEVRPRRAMDSGWAWMTVACLLIGVSGMVRTFQDRQFGLVKSSVPPSPFPLDEVPARIGEWSSIEHDDIKLDPLTVRITGSTDHIQRTYLDRLTGTKISVLILYGPAEPVAPHTPEACYPATGWAPEERVSEFKLPLQGEEARFRRGIYTRPGAGRPERAKVYYSFRLGGDWAPDIAIGKKFHRTNAGILKVQIQRLMGPNEHARAENEPVETFLAELIPELESRIAESAARPALPAS